MPHLFVVIGLVLQIEKDREGFAGVEAVVREAEEAGAVELRVDEGTVVGVFGASLGGS